MCQPKLHHVFYLLGLQAWMPLYLAISPLLLKPLCPVGSFRSTWTNLITSASSATPSSKTTLPMPPLRREWTVSSTIVGGTIINKITKNKHSIGPALLSFFFLLVISTSVCLLLNHIDLKHLTRHSWLITFPLLSTRDIWLQQMLKDSLITAWSWASWLF